MICLRCRRNLKSESNTHKQNYSNEEITLPPCAKRFIILGNKSCLRRFGIPNLRQCHYKEEESRKPCWKKATRKRKWLIKRRIRVIIRENKTGRIILDISLLIATSSFSHSHQKDKRYDYRRKTERVQQQA